MPAEILVPLTLIFGVLSLIILPWGIMASHSGRSRIALVLIYLSILTIAYFMFRAGIIADERGIGGNEVAPFYGTEWYFMLGFTVLAVFYQMFKIYKLLRSARSSTAD
jgi:NADH:ubiquinone oxidoreductase subunit 3 (subunit A)